MKRCGSCNQIYNDDLSFCLTDGKPLLTYDDPEETVLSPFTSNYIKPQAKKQNKTLVIILFSLLGISIVSFITVYYYSARRMGQEVSVADFKPNSLVTDTVKSNEQNTRIVSPSKILLDIVKKLNLSRINFEAGKSDIPSEAEPFLQEAAEELKNFSQDSVIEIGGHTDNVGSSTANQKISEARSNSIRKKLIEYGVDSDMLIAKGYGGTRPAADNSTDEGRFINRRIEYIVVKR